MPLIRLESLSGGRVQSLAEVEILFSCHRSEVKNVNAENRVYKYLNFLRRPFLLIFPTNFCLHPFSPGLNKRQWNSDYSQVPYNCFHRNSTVPCNLGMIRQNRTCHYRKPSVKNEVTIDIELHKSLTHRIKKIREANRATAEFYELPKHVFPVMSFCYSLLPSGECRGLKSTQDIWLP